MKHLITFENYEVENLGRSFDKDGHEIVKYRNIYLILLDDDIGNNFNNKGYYIHVGIDDDKLGLELYSFLNKEEDIRPTHLHNTPPAFLGYDIETAKNIIDKYWLSIDTEKYNL